MDYPPVIALIITFRRLPLALETIRSVKAKVEYPNIGFHIADDGSGDEYVGRLVEEIGPSYSTVVSVTNPNVRGVGANMNMGISTILAGRADLWLHLEDDWVLPEPIDLRPCVELLMEDETVGMVRLGRLTAEEVGTTFAHANKLWWRMKKGSNSYIFTGNAALRHRRFAVAYGPYTQGLTPGRTELDYCAKFDKKKGPDIAYPAWLNYTQTFQHIGDHQSFKWYMENDGLTAEQVATKFEAQDSQRG